MENVAESETREGFVGTNDWVFYLLVAIRAIALTETAATAYVSGITASP
jgi:hypothetical protein